MLVLSGSLGSTVDMWRPQVGPLSERFRLIRVDHRGHGGSPVPQGPYRMADLAGDVIALLDGLGWTGWRGAGCRWAAWSACTWPSSTRIGSPG